MHLSLADMAGKVAERIGQNWPSRQTLHQIEQGRIIPPPEKFQALVDAYVPGNTENNETEKKWLWLLYEEARAAKRTSDGAEYVRGLLSDSPDRLEPVTVYVLEGRAKTTTDRYLIRLMAEFLARNQENKLIFIAPVELHGHDSRLPLEPSEIAGWERFEDAIRSKLAGRGRSAQEIEEIVACVRAALADRVEAGCGASKLPLSAFQRLLQQLRQEADRASVGDRVRFAEQIVFYNLPEPWPLTSSVQEGASSQASSPGSSNSAELHRACLELWRLCRPETTTSYAVNSDWKWVAGYVCVEASEDLYSWMWLPRPVVERDLKLIRRLEENHVLQNLDLISNLAGYRDEGISTSVHRLPGRG